MCEAVDSLARLEKALFKFMTAWLWIGENFSREKLQMIPLNPYSRLNVKAAVLASNFKWQVRKQASEHSQGSFISGFVLDPDCMTSWLTRPPRLGDKTGIPLSSYSPAPWHLHWGLTTITRFQGIVGIKNREKWNDIEMARVGGTFKQPQIFGLSTKDIKVCKFKQQEKYPAVPAKVNAMLSSTTKIFRIVLSFLHAIIYIICMICQITLDSCLYPKWIKLWMYPSIFPPLSLSELQPPSPGVLQLGCCTPFHGQNHTSFSWQVTDLKEVKG